MCFSKILTGIHLPGRRFYCDIFSFSRTTPLTIYRLKKFSTLMLRILQAAFVPSSDNALDTSYFTSRYSWNPSDEFVNEASEYEDSSDNGSMSGSSSCVSNHHEELV